MEPVQVIETPIESAAWEVATCWHSEGVQPAQALMKAKAVALDLTRGEIGALANSAMCMIHGKRWKKGPSNA